jgi:uncharacterized membrane protein YedE/YeeE
MLTVDPVAKLLLGLFTGLVFGFLMQKGWVTRYRVILGQFLLRDFTMVKIFLTAIVSGAVGIWLLRQLGLVELHVKSALLSANVIGGIIFGVGMALLGYCPGTAVAAVGDRSRHAIPGLIGMIVGAGVYAEAHAWLRRHLLKEEGLGKVTAVEVTGWSPWWFILGLTVVAAVLFYALERWEQSARSAEVGTGGCSP